MSPRDFTESLHFQRDPRSNIYLLNQRPTPTYTRLSHTTAAPFEHPGETGCNVCTAPRTDPSGSVHCGSNPEQLPELQTVGISAVLVSPEKSCSSRAETNRFRNEGEDLLPSRLPVSVDVLEMQESWPHAQPQQRSSLGPGHTHPGEGRTLRNVQEATP